MISVDEIFGAIIASLGIAAFGFLYFVSGDGDSYEAIADERRDKLGVPKKNKKKEKTDSKAPKKEKKKKPEQKVAAEETTPLVTPEPPVVVEAKSVEKVVEKPVKSTKKEPTPPPAEAPKPKKNDLVIPSGKMSEEDAEGVITAVIKKLGGRVPKGSKVTLASNVDKLKAKNEELTKENQKTQKELSEQMTINFDIESKVQDAKKNAEQLEKQAKDALVRAQKAEKVGKEKETEFQRKIENAEEGLAKEVETLRTNNSALQSALMANAQKLALMGDAESLKKDLENELTKRFDLDTQCKSLTEQVGVLTTARDAALAENATLSANVAQLEASQSSSPDLTNDLDAAKAQATELMTQLEQAKNASTDIQSKLDEVSTELSVTSTALEASKAEVTALQATKTESETAQTQAKEEVQSAQDKIEALEAQLNDLKSQAEQSSGQSNDELAAVQVSLETANGSLATANEKCASLEVDLAAVKDGAEATNAQMEEIKNQLNEKVAELEKKDAEIQQIESSSQAVSEKFKNIEAQCEEQMTKLKNIEDERDALSAQNAELSQKVASNEDSLTVVNVADDTAKDTRISQLEEEISKLNEQVDQAKTKNEAAEAKIVELEKQSEDAPEVIAEPANDENTEKTESDENDIKALEESQREIEIHVAKLAQLEFSSVPKNEFEKVQEENSKLKGILNQTEEMLVELQSSVRKEEDSFVQKIRDLETRLEEYECNGAAGDSNSSAQTSQALPATKELDSWDIVITPLKSNGVNQGHLIRK
jgi:DNA repair exonuclease SbcCD ATPase subunit